MSKTKMTLVFPADVIETLRERGAARGFVSPQSYARYLVMRELKLMETTGSTARNHARIFQDILEEVRQLRREAEHGQ